MTFLEIVTKAMEKAGVREDAPATLVGATGIVSDFVGHVKDAYKRIQVDDHGDAWFFRQSLDQTLAITASDDEYAMPAGLQDLNWRTITIYTTAKTDETRVKYLDYYEWRMDYDTKTVTEQRPTCIVMRPDGVLQLFPVPDQAYTLRFDGVMEVDELSANADEPIIPSIYHDVLVWAAVMRHAKHHEDGAMLADAKDEFRPIYDSMVERQLPGVKVRPKGLY